MEAGPKFKDVLVYERIYWKEVWRLCGTQVDLWSGLVFAAGTIVSYVVYNSKVNDPIQWEALAWSVIGGLAVSVFAAVLKSVLYANASILNNGISAARATVSKSTSEIELLACGPVIFSQHKHGSSYVQIMAFRVTNKSKVHDARIALEFVFDDGSTYQLHSYVAPGSGIDGRAERGRVLPVGKIDIYENHITFEVKDKRGDGTSQIHGTVIATDAVDGTCSIAWKVPSYEPAVLVRNE